MASRVRRSWPLVLLAVASIALGGCGTCKTSSARPFRWGADSFAFRNELLRTYSIEANGQTVSRKTVPPPDYALHCFVMARAAREFLYHARFDPALPKAGPEAYGDLIQAVVNRDSRCPSPEEEKVIIPGFANLWEFSSSFELLLKSECGGAWRSYLQRGNWRMVFPFTRRQQLKTAKDLRARLQQGLLPIVHLVDFPGLKINHVVLLTGVVAASGEWSFAAYDPNNPERPALLRFDEASRTFLFECNQYFAGGAVNVYEIYRNGAF